MDYFFSLTERRDARERFERVYQSPPSVVQRVGGDDDGYTNPWLCNRCLTIIIKNDAGLQVSSSMDTLRPFASSASIRRRGVKFPG